MEERRKRRRLFSLGMGESGENYAGIWTFDTEMSSEHPGGNAEGQV